MDGHSEDSSLAGLAQRRDGRDSPNLEQGPSQAKRAHSVSLCDICACLTANNTCTSVELLTVRVVILQKVICCH